jgi:hypothetical protein
MAKWTKKDINELCSQLDGAWLFVRPHDVSGWAAAAERFRAVLAVPQARKEAVLGGVRSFEQLFARRYNEYCATIGNEIARFGKTLDDELVQRFTGLARETDAAAKRATQLRERVLSEGLPPEVVAYDPTVPRRRS